MVLVLLGIFVAGIVTGGFLTLRFGRELAARRAGPEQWAPNHLKRLAERLDLHPEQLEQLRPIVRRNMEELGRLRSESGAANKAIMDRMEREIAEKLTPEQRVKFEQFNKELKERAKRIMPERRNRPTGQHSDQERPPTGPGPATPLPPPSDGP